MSPVPSIVILAIADPLRFSKIFLESQNIRFTILEASARRSDQEALDYAGEMARINPIKGGVKHFL
jgi:hypothetical protein